MERTKPLLRSPPPERNSPCSPKTQRRVSPTKPALEGSASARLYRELRATADEDVPLDQCHPRIRRLVRDLVKEVSAFMKPRTYNGKFPASDFQNMVKKFKPHNQRLKEFSSFLNVKSQMGRRDYADESRLVNGAGLQRACIHFFEQFDGVDPFQDDVRSPTGRNLAPTISITPSSSMKTPRGQAPSYTTFSMAICLLHDLSGDHEEASERLMSLSAQAGQSYEAAVALRWGCLEEMRKELLKLHDGADEIERTVEALTAEAKHCQREADEAQRKALAVESQCHAEEEEVKKLRQQVATFGWGKGWREEVQFARAKLAATLSSIIQDNIEAVSKNWAALQDHAERAAQPFTQEVPDCMRRRHLASLDRLAKLGEAQRKACCGSTPRSQGRVCGTPISPTRKDTTRLSGMTDYSTDDEDDLNEMNQQVGQQPGNELDLPELGFDTPRLHICSMACGPVPEVTAPEKMLRGCVRCFTDFGKRSQPLPIEGRSGVDAMRKNSTQWPAPQEIVETGESDSEYDSDEDDLPDAEGEDHWRLHESPGGKRYYFNVVSRRSTFARPAGVSDKKARAAAAQEAVGLKRARVAAARKRKEANIEAARRKAEKEAAEAEEARLRALKEAREAEEARKRRDKEKEEAELAAIEATKARSAAERAEGLAKDAMRVLEKEAKEATDMQKVVDEEMEKLEADRLSLHKKVAQVVKAQVEKERMIKEAEEYERLAEEAEKHIAGAKEVGITVRRSLLVEAEEMRALAKQALQGVPEREEEIQRTKLEVAQSRILLTQKELKLEELAKQAEKESAEATEALQHYRALEKRKNSLLGNLDKMNEIAARELEEAEEAELEYLREKEEAEQAQDDYLKEMREAQEALEKLDDAADADLSDFSSEDPGEEKPHKDGEDKSKDAVNSSRHPVDLPAITLYFDVALPSVNKERFDRDLRQKLTAFDLSGDEVWQLQVVLHEGSLVAEVSGELELMRCILTQQLSTLRKLTVQGCTASLSRDEMEASRVWREANSVKGQAERHVANYRAALATAQRKGQPGKPEATNLRNAERSLRVAERDLEAAATLKRQAELAAAAEHRELLKKWFGEDALRDAPQIPSSFWPPTGPTTCTSPLEADGEHDRASHNVLDADLAYDKPGTGRSPMWTRHDKSEAQQPVDVHVRKLAELAGSHASSAATFLAASKPYRGATKKVGRFFGVVPSRSEARATEAAIPSAIHVECLGMDDAHFGVYYRVPGRSVNGFPIWKHEVNSRWIFSGDGEEEAGRAQWFIGDEHEEGLAFKVHTGLIASEVEHLGKMPHEMKRHRWQRLIGHSWVNDPDILVVADVSRDRAARKIQAVFRGKLVRARLKRNQKPPETDLPRRDGPTLQGLLEKTPWKDVVAQNLVQKSRAEQLEDLPKLLRVCLGRSAAAFGGVYRLLERRQKNGFPLWKLQGSDHWIFSGPGGQWFLGDHQEEREDFRVNTGHVASMHAHGGVSPHRLRADAWLRWEGEDWVPEASIRITLPRFEDYLKRAPQCLRLKMRDDTDPCVGIYNLVRWEVRNGYPIWKLEKSKIWLFSGLDGQWFIGDEEERHLGFQVNTGHIASHYIHGELHFPHEVPPGEWHRFDSFSRQWVDDDSIVIHRVDDDSRPTVQSPPGA
eukprot:TRINITY_DN44979_c0_g1_i2.p1 TRINITY_DN44979_c0_g1~~TRINITY_DN44979_c0_g1_i2.p1  ORF type:complete len:1635 (-),score=424.83 TRINITY_DN44979_c0_g1_i2:236-5140(-)